MIPLWICLNFLLHRVPGVERQGGGGREIAGRKKEEVDERVVFPSLRRAGQKGRKEREKKGLLGRQKVRRPPPFHYWR